MSHHLNFGELFRYDPGKSGITVPVTLRLGPKVVRAETKLDTGAGHCIFQRGYGEDLDLDIESGHLLLVGTATGSFITYGHSVTLLVGDFSFDALVYFAKDHAFNRNVLGRNGFLNLVQLGLVDYDGKLLAATVMKTSNVASVWDHCRNTQTRQRTIARRCHFQRYS